MTIPSLVTCSSSTAASAAVVGGRDSFCASAGLSHRQRALLFLKANGLQSAPLEILDNGYSFRFFVPLLKLFLGRLSSRCCPSRIRYALSTRRWTLFSPRGPSGASPRPRGV